MWRGSLWCCALQEACAVQPGGPCTCPHNAAAPLSHTPHELHTGLSLENKPPPLLGSESAGDKWKRHYALALWSFSFPQIILSFLFICFCFSFSLPLSNSLLHLSTLSLFFLRMSWQTLPCLQGCIFAVLWAEWFCILPTWPVIPSPKLGLLLPRPGFANSKFCLPEALGFSTSAGTSS